MEKNYSKLNLQFCKANQVRGRMHSMHSRRPATMPYCCNSTLRHANSRVPVRRTLIRQDVLQVVVVAAAAPSRKFEVPHLEQPCSSNLTPLARFIPASLTLNAQTFYCAQSSPDFCITHLPPLAPPSFHFFIARH